MPTRVAVSQLNASTIDILNTIRANASAEYQALVPAVDTATDIPKVGEILYGYPALANQFVNALVNRIALVAVKSATFNNDYAELKKGFLQFGETVEEIFVQIAKGKQYSAEKAEAREFKKTLPDVKSAFHALNWKVVYPITVQQEDLRQAFLSMSGVQDLIAKIINAVYVAEQYDEFLLFKYLIIKAVSHGKMFPVAFNSTNMKNAAKKFRGISNNVTFMNTKYNVSGVLTNTPKADQYIFMDTQFNADYDVDVLSAAFNMDKATFMGKLKLIDDFTTFDNERFSQIRAESDCLEEVTASELSLMANVKAILIDKEWFQVYDNLSTMTETPVQSGLYWNYFYHTWKTISSSPFSNAIVFVESGTSTALPDDIVMKVVDKSVTAYATILTLAPKTDTVSVAGSEYKFVQTSTACEERIAVHPYGAIIYPTDDSDNLPTNIKLNFTIRGTGYESDAVVNYSTVAVGAEINFSKQS